MAAAKADIEASAAAEREALARKWAIERMLHRQAMALEVARRQAAEDRARGLRAKLAGNTTDMQRKATKRARTSTRHKVAAIAQDVAQLKAQARAAKIAAQVAPAAQPAPEQGLRLAEEEVPGLGLDQET